MSASGLFEKIFGSRGPRALAHGSTLEGLGLLSARESNRIHREQDHLLVQRMQPVPYTIEYSEDSSDETVSGMLSLTTTRITSDLFT